MNESGTRAVRGARAIDPVAVELYDDDNAPALYIDDGSPTPALHLALHNQSGSALEFDAGASHHVELLFRPGVLSQRALGTLASQNAARDVLSSAAQSWGLSLAPAEAGMPVSLQLRYLGADRSFESDARMILSLNGLSAAGAQGARPTQVQVTVQGVRFGVDPPFATTRHRHLNLLHWGRAGLPLHFGFPGSAVLVNDGASHDPLLLRVVNTSLDETLCVAPDAKDQAVFDLYFDMGDEDWWWTLEAQVPHIEVSWDGSHFEDVNEATGHQGPAQRWEIKLPADGLAPRKHVDIRIGNLHSSAPGQHQRVPRCAQPFGLSPRQAGVRHQPGAADRGRCHGTDDSPRQGRGARRYEAGARPEQTESRNVYRGHRADVPSRVPVRAAERRVSTLPVQHGRHPRARSPHLHGQVHGLPGDPQRVESSANRRWRRRGASDSDRVAGADGRLRAPHDDLRRPTDRPQCDLQLSKLVQFRGASLSDEGRKQRVARPDGTARTSP